jgi:hypothetical protein
LLIGVADQGDDVGRFENGCRKKLKKLASEQQNKKKYNFQPTVREFSRRGELQRRDAATACCDFLKMGSE